MAGLMLLGVVSVIFSVYFNNYKASLVIE
jgi:hypothetical protein